MASKESVVGAGGPEWLMGAKVKMAKAAATNTIMNTHRGNRYEFFEKACSMFNQDSINHGFLNEAMMFFDLSFNGTFQ